jgi:uncharacterized protein (DUF2062 family)
MRIKKHLPSREQLRQTKSLRFLGEMIFEPNLWHFNRHSVSYAVLIGSVCCFLPIPFQMIPCVLLCVAIRCNVPLSVAIVWISNPITMTPMMYFAYRVGSWILGLDGHIDPVNLTLEWLQEQIAVIWLPLLLGCLVSGFTMGIAGFTIVRLYWRWRISRYKLARQRRRQRQ